MKSFNFINFKSWLVLCLLLFTGIGTMWGEDDAITLANGVGTGSGTSYSITWSGTSCDITQTKGSSSTSVSSSYISAPRWYQSHKIAFKAKSGYTLTGATVKCTTNATALKNSTYSTGASATVSNDVVTIKTSGDFDVTMGAQSRISSITVSYTTTTKYTVTVANDIANGTVTASPTSAASGTEVTLTATPSTGYEFGSWNVTNASTNAAITVTNDKFEMPAANVNVSATFNVVQGDGEPSGDEVTVTFTNLGYTSWGKNATFSGSTYDELSQTKDNVVFDYTRGSGSTYANTTSIRFYKDNKLTFTAPNGYKITSIVWTGSSFKEDVTTDVETCTSTTSALSWSGNASSVTFTRPSNATSYATLSSVSVTLEADATKYDVKFYVDGEEQTGLAQQVVEDGHPTAVTEPTKTGYTFEGWYETSDFSGDKIADVTSVTISADKNFYGRFNIIDYTITYNLNEGTNAQGNPASYTIETATINLADARKDGFIFQGWFDNADCTGDAVTTIAQGSTGDKEFWAKWTEIPANPSTVTFNVGEHGTCDVTELTEETVGAGVALPAVTANEGWVFKGWSTENPATAETIVSAGDDGMYHILANTSLYAFYKVKPATPTFNSEAGAIEKGTEVTISCTTEGAVIYYTTNGDEPTAESTAYSEAIAVNAEQTIKAIAILDGEQSEVASAAYTIAQHTAQFSINGVITAANNCTVAKGEAITFPDDPTAPEEHVFIGWKKGGAEVTTPQADAIATVDKAAEVMGTEDVIYYAVWAVGEEGGEVTEELTNAEINSLSSSAALAYATEKTYTDGTINYSIYAYTDNTNRKWIQVKKDQGVYVKMTAPSAIKNVSVTLTAPSNSSGGINDIIKHTAYSGYVALTTSDCTYSSSSPSVASTDVITNNVATLEPMGENSTLYLKVSTGARIWGISVTYGSGSTYSDYCTKVVIREISSVAVKTAPTTVNYCEGEKFDPAGLEITVNYTEGAPEDVAYAGNEAKFSFSPALDADLATTNKQVTITYKNNTCQQAINVRTVSINAPTTEEGTYTVKVGDAEAVTADGSTIAAKKGQKIVLASTANPGYRVQGTPFVVKDENDGDVKVSKSGDTYSFDMPDKNVTITAKYSKLYTLTAAEMTNGSIAIKWNDAVVTEAVKGNKIVIDVTSDPHYTLNSLYYMTEGSETQNAINQTDNVYSFMMEDANTTIYAVFEEDEKHDAIFYVNGEESSRASVYTGANVEFPAENPDDVYGKTFMGWVSEEINGTQETAPTYASPIAMGNADLNFYAVFATVEEGQVIKLLDDDMDISGTSAVSSRNGWSSFSNVYGGDGSIRISTGNNAGQMVTNALANLTGTATITFKILNWSSLETGKVTLSTNKGTLTATSFSGNSSTTWKECSTTLTGGDATTKVTFKGTSGSRAYIKDILITCQSVNISGYCTTVKQLPTLSFAAPTYNAVMGEVFEAPELTKPDGVTVEYSSSETEVATVDTETGAVNLVGPGTTTITASFNGNETYWASSASYQLIVAGKLTFAAYNKNDKESADNRYFATFSSESPVHFDETVEIYTVDGSDGTLSYEQVENNEVPANTGVLVKTKSNVNYATYVIKETSNEFEHNDLRSGQGEMIANEAYHVYYMLAYRPNSNDRTTLGFYWGAAEGGAFTSRKGAAYLDLVNYGAPIRGFAFDDLLNPTNPPITTDVETLSGSALEGESKKLLVRGQLVIVRGNKMYDMNGRVVK